MANIWGKIEVLLYLFILSLPNCTIKGNQADSILLPPVKLPLPNQTIVTTKLETLQRHHVHQVHAI